MEYILMINLPRYPATEDTLSNELENDNIRSRLTTHIQEWLWGYLPRNLTFDDIQVRVENPPPA